MSSVSDAHRVPVAVASALGAACMMIWWGWASDRGAIGAVAVLDRPLGERVVLSLLRVEAITPPDRLVVGHADLHVPVRADVTGRVLGEEITIGGVVERDEVRAEWIEAAPHRPAKHALGILGLAVAGALWVGATRVTRDGLALRG